MAAGFTVAAGGAQKGDGFARPNPPGEVLDLRPLLPHLQQVPPAVRGPGDGEDALAVDGGVEFDAGAEVRVPAVPRLVGLADAAGAVAADEQAEPVAGLRRIVPSPCPDLAGGHIQG